MAKALIIGIVAFGVGLFLSSTPLYTLEVHLWLDQYGVAIMSGCVGGLTMIWWQENIPPRLIWWR